LSNRVASRAHNFPPERLPVARPAKRLRRKAKRAAGHRGERPVCDCKKERTFQKRDVYATLKHAKKLEAM